MRIGERVDGTDSRGIARHQPDGQRIFVQRLEQQGRSALRLFPAHEIVRHHAMDADVVRRHRRQRLFPHFVDVRRRCASLPLQHLRTRGQHVRITGKGRHLLAGIRESLVGMIRAQDVDPQNHDVAIRYRRECDGLVDVRQRIAVP